MIDIELESLADPEASMFHNLRYTNNQDNSNRNKTTFSIINVGGNNIGVEINGAYYEVNQVKLHINGAWENAEFLNMLEKILDVENRSDVQNAAPHPKTLGDVIRDKMKIMEIMEQDQKADDIQVGDAVHSPNHYTVGGIETIDYIRAKLTVEELRGYYRGNLLKYLSRARHKDGLQDYKKAQVYLQWLIELEESNEQ